MSRKKRNHHWRYKNCLIVLTGFCLAFLLSRSEAVRLFLTHLGNFGYLGAFIAGILFVSTFTVATGSLILLALTETLSPIEIGVIAGLGAIIGDLLIFRFVKDGLAAEIADIYHHLDRKKHIIKVFHSRYFSWTLPVVGSLIIASPLPDELGISLLGLSSTSTFRFVVVSYILNSLGIFLVVSASTFVRP